MPFQSPTGYPFDEDKEAYVDKLTASEWNNLNKAVNSLVAWELSKKRTQPMPWVYNVWHSMQDFVRAGWSGAYTCPEDRIIGYPILIPAGAKIDRFGVAIKTLPASGYISTALYKPSTEGWPDTSIAQQTELFTSSGDKELTIDEITINDGGWYWLMVQPLDDNVEFWMYEAGDHNPVGSQPNQAGNSSTPYWDGYGDISTGTVTLGAPDGWADSNWPRVALKNQT